MITCGGCGYILADSEKGRPPKQRTPCSQCRATTHHMSVHVCESIAITDGAGVEGITYAPARPWFEKWTEALAFLAETETIYQRDVSDFAEVRRVVEGYFKACRELAEWIEQSTGVGALAHVHANPDLKICDAFVQVIKHHTRTNPASMSARISRIDNPSSGPRIAIAYRPNRASAEQEVDALDLARRTAAAWRQFFTQHGLSEPT